MSGFRKTRTLPAASRAPKFDPAAKPRFSPASTTHSLSRSSLVDLGAASAVVDHDRLPQPILPLQRVEHPQERAGLTEGDGAVEALIGAAAREDGEDSSKIEMSSQIDQCSR